MNTDCSKYIYAATADNCYSEDAWRIQHDSDFVPVFLYGCEKYLYSEYYHLKHYPRYGIGTTTAPMFQMYRHTRDNHPIVVGAPGKAPASLIFGEIFLVPPDILFDLDALFQRHIYFERKTQMFNYCLVSDTTSPRKRYMSAAYTYLGIPDVWASQIRDGTLLPMEATVNAENPARPFYQWTKKDDAPNEAANRRKR